jgi:S-DNA-T family DNA segregation ATPase FtsK/SpoIIIE
VTDIVEGRVVSREEFARRFNARTVARESARVAGSDVATLARVTRTVVTHDVTRAVARQAVYVPAGVRALWRYVRENYGSARYIAQIDAAYAQGDMERAERLTTAMEAERGRRWSRVMDVLKLGVQLVRILPWLLLIGAGGLIGLGVLIAVAGGDASLVWAPFRWIVAGIAFAIWAYMLTAVFLPWVVLGIVVLALWATGRRAGDLPQFLAPTVQRETATRELIPDEGAILEALRNLNLAPLNRKFKEGWLPRWPLATGRDGNGYRTQLELPPGVTVDMINQRKDVLAHNLVRLPVEVWPTEPQKQPGVLDLWVADQGLLSGPVAPYPLLTDGTCDYFKGVPVGTDQRGQVLTGRLMACNYAIGGVMGGGKSSLVLNLVTGAALDPLVDIDVYVMAYNVDYDPFKDRLSTLIKGDEDEHITAAMDGLRELREEVTKRGKLLDTLGGEETKVTRALAKQDCRLRPRLVIFDECQELFRHEKYGEQAKQFAIKVMMKARKCAITLVWVTPEPSADSLPRELPRVVSHGVCFAINDYIGNDAILGTGSYKRGISAVDLDPQENIGTAMAFGFSSRPGLLRSFYIRKDAATDQLSPIAQRSVDPWRGAKPSDEDADRDLIADVADVLGSQDVMRARDVVAGLRQLAPGYEVYATMSGAKLIQRLKAEGVRATLKDGYEVVHRDRVYQVLDAREQPSSEPSH